MLAFALITLYLALTIAISRIRLITGAVRGEGEIVGHGTFKRDLLGRKTYPFHIRFSAANIYQLCYSTESSRNPDKKQQIRQQYFYHPQYRIATPCRWLPADTAALLLTATSITAFALYFLK